MGSDSIDSFTFLKSKSKDGESIESDPIDSSLTPLILREIQFELDTRKIFLLAT